MNLKRNLYTALMTASCLAMIPNARAQFHSGSGSIEGHLCVGFDCVPAESFGLDLLRLKQNNIRLHFDDTSSPGGMNFPLNDWRIIINDSAPSGASYFAVEDTTAVTIPFRIEAGAPSHSLYVEDDGDIGIGTSTPAADLHVVDGDQAILRLEQDGSMGFTPQIWDVAGNETQFSIRDVTNGTKLPLSIRVGAPTDSLFIAADGDVGLGTGSPSAPLHVKRSDGTARLLVEETSGALASRTVLELRNNGNPRIDLVDSNSGVTWRYESVGGGGSFRFFRVGSPIALGVGAAGNVTVAGTMTTGGPQCGGGCDFVFDPNYELESIEQHAASMWENSHLPAVGPTGSSQSINLTEKVGGLINELEKAHIYIERLHEQGKERAKKKDKRIRELEQHLVERDTEFARRLSRLETLLGAVPAD